MNGSFDEADERNDFSAACLTKNADMKAEIDSDQPSLPCAPAPNMVLEGCSPSLTKKKSRFRIESKGSRKLASAKKHAEDTSGVAAFMVGRCSMSPSLQVRADVLPSLLRRSDMNSAAEPMVHLPTFSSDVSSACIAMIGEPCVAAFADALASVSVMNDSWVNVESPKKAGVSFPTMVTINDCAATAISTTFMMSTAITERDRSDEGTYRPSVSLSSLQALDENLSNDDFKLLRAKERFIMGHYDRLIRDEERNLDSSHSLYGNIAYLDNVAEGEQKGDGMRVRKVLPLFLDLKHELSLHPQDVENEFLPCFRRQQERKLRQDKWDAFSVSPSITSTTTFDVIISGRRETVTLVLQAMAAWIRNKMRLHNFGIIQRRGAVLSVKLNPLLPLGVTLNQMLQNGIASNIFIEITEPAAQFAAAVRDVDTMNYCAIVASVNGACCPTIQEFKRFKQ